MTSNIENLYKVKKQDISKVESTFMDAFREDPLWKAMLDGVPNREKKYKAFFEMPTKYCMKYGKVFATSQYLEGAAAWIPGELTDMTFWRVIRSGTLTTGLKIGMKFAKKMLPVEKPIREDREVNMKGIPFTYLQVIGVASEHHGKGYGGQLLKAIIEESEIIKRPLYIETQKEGNVKLYEHFGFELIKTLQLPVIDIPIWEMVRYPAD